MSEANHYVIPEEFKVMAAYAVTVANRMEWKLHEEPDWSFTSLVPVRDSIGYVDKKLLEFEGNARNMISDVNRLGNCVSQVEIMHGMERLEKSLERLVKSIDGVRCSYFMKNGTGKRLLLSVMRRPVLDTIALLRNIEQVVRAPEKFAVMNGNTATISLSMSYEIGHEMLELQMWRDSLQQEKECRFWIWTLMSFFFLGWLWGDDD